MKRWGSPKTIGGVSAGIALVLAATVVWLVNKPPTADCAAETPTDHQAHGIRATKVVVQPWLGEHQVYGIFMVPNRYKQNRKQVVTMTVRGFDHSFTVSGGPDKQFARDVIAEPGHYFVRSYVPTRMALWFLVNGLFGDLRRPCNWTLALTERSS